MDIEPNTRKHRPSVEEFVVNWHVTEPCNYSCRYCYAKWTKEKHSKELHRDIAKTDQLLAELHRYFDPVNSSNRLASKLDWKSVRLTIAGGEPMLLKGKLVHIIEESRRLGFKVSLITNGSFLSESWLESTAPHMDLLGISVDSADAESNRAIGRIDGHGRLLPIPQVGAMIATARRANPNLAIKINTVVNAANVNEDMSAMIETLAPDRWKVLRALPVITDALSVTSEQFESFLIRHRGLSKIMTAEDNTDMTESYVMIDPHGRFFQNTPNAGGGAYLFSDPILDVGADRAFTQIQFDADRFSSRYRSGIIKLVQHD